MNNPDDQFEQPFRGHEPFTGRIPMDIESTRRVFDELEVVNVCLLNTLLYDKGATNVRHISQHHDQDIVNSVWLSVNFRTIDSATDATRLEGVLIEQQEREFTEFKERLYSKLDNVGIRDSVKTALGECYVVCGNYHGVELYFVESYTDKSLVDGQQYNRPVRTWTAYDGPPAEWEMVDWQDAHLEAVAGNRSRANAGEVVQKVAEFLARLSYRFCMMHPMFWEVDDDRS